MDTDEIQGYIDQRSILPRLELKHSATSNRNKKMGRLSSSLGFGVYKTVGSLVPNERDRGLRSMGRYPHKDPFRYDLEYCAQRANRRDASPRWIKRTTFLVLGGFKHHRERRVVEPTRTPTPTYRIQAKKGHDHYQTSLERVRQESPFPTRGS